MSAWNELEGDLNTETAKEFEDNFVVKESREFKKLDDSENYIKSLGRWRIK